MSQLPRVCAYAIALALVAPAQTHEKRIVPVESSQRQNFDHQPKVAVLAGVGHYALRSGLTQLRYPSHDVELMESELNKQGYKVVALKDQEATRGSIERALRDVSDLVDRGSGTVLFFFSGHGFADKGSNYLATYEASIDDLSGSGLSVQRVEELLKGTGAPRQVMFIDACRDEAGKGAGARSFDRLQGAAGLRALLSTKAGRISYEDESLGSGVFTHFLVEGLRGQAAGQDGLITFRDLADYVTDSVSSYGFRSGRMQVPYEAGEASGDFLLARATAAPVPTPAPTPTPVFIARGPQPGQVKVNPKDGQRYVWIPAGSFYMGCSPGDTNCDSDESPARNVSITKGFWLGQTAVTQAAYTRVMGTNPSHFSGANLPVESVNWDDAKHYCETVDGRLPTEAEWEYAARAGNTSVRYGDMDAIAWYADNSGRRPIESARIWQTDQTNYLKRLYDNGAAPHPVAQKQPNGWNLYDMLGNVLQWTADWYGSKYYGQKESTDPQGPPTGQNRVLRGSSWASGPHEVRVSYRGDIAPSFRPEANGFRCVGE